MKLIKTLAVLLLLFGCASKPPFPHSDKSVIPHTWLTKKTSVKKIHEGKFRLCSAIKQITSSIEHTELNEGELYPIENFEFEESKCIKDNGNPFEHDLVEGYQVYEYSGIEGRRLESGYALVIDGLIVDVIVVLIAE